VNDLSTPQIYTLSLHDALPICHQRISVDSWPMPRAFPSTVIENLQPLIDGGRYLVKRIAGEDLVVEADIFKDGHDVVAAVLKWRSEEHTSELQSRFDLVCRLLL